MMANNCVNCISDFLKTIQELNNSYSSLLYGTTPVESMFLYRGISNYKYQLIPAIFRKSLDFDITIEKYVDNNKYVEYGSEESILNDFIAQACAYVNEDPSQNLYRWADYAQHYGVPTRFLDWTGNPLVALYFACRDDRYNYKNKDLGGENAVVWMMHIKNYNYFVGNRTHGSQTYQQKSGITRGETIDRLIKGDKTIEYPILYKPYYLDLRMSAQASYFMVWGDRREPFETFFSEENFLRSNKVGAGRIYKGNQNEVVYSFSISVDQKQSILRELDTCGISEKTLFPGLDGIGRYIEMKYRFDLEEAKGSL
jgi:hypothetical protein